MELSEIRKKLKLTQNELADFFDMTRQHFSMAETGRRSLTDNARSLYLDLIDHIKKKKNSKAEFALDKMEQRKLSKKLIRLQIHLNTATEKYNEMLRDADDITATRDAISEMNFSNLPKAERERLGHWRAQLVATKNVDLLRVNKSAILKQEIKMKLIEAEVNCLQSALS